jgi:hypothetical protein
VSCILSQYQDAKQRPIARASEQLNEHEQIQFQWIRTFSSGVDHTSLPKLSLWSLVRSPNWPSSFGVSKEILRHQLPVNEMVSQISQQNSAQERLSSM